MPLNIQERQIIFNKKKTFMRFFEYNKVDVQSTSLFKTRQLSAIGNDNKTIDQSLIPRTERTLTRVLIAEYISELGE